MSNAKTHRLGAGIAVGTTTALLLDFDDRDLAKSVAAGGLAYFPGTLPDIIEPATSPNHRQFFHSYAFLGLLGTGMYKAYKWETENEWQKLTRFSLLVTGGAYATHLLMDSSTPKGLPVI